MILHKYLDHEQLTLTETSTRNFLGTKYIVQYTVKDLHQQVQEKKELDLFNWLREMFTKVEFIALPARTSKLTIVSFRATKKETPPSAT